MGDPHIIVGLRSALAWSPVDVDLMFSGDGKDIGDEVDTFLTGGVELTTPEKRMSVEEWIYHHASQAEKRLKHQCEAMVSAFEREGTRAMRVLEELIVE